MKNTFIAGMSFFALGICLIGGCGKTDTANASVMNEEVKSQETTEEITEVTTTEEGVVTISDPDTLTFIGHASMKMKTKDGTVIYVDPSYEGDYTEPADIILITHTHEDHNKPEIVTKKDTTVILKSSDMLISDGENLDYQEQTINDVTVRAVPAGGGQHNINDCVGYLIMFDGIKLYHAGDTAKLDSMADLAKENIDYAFLPVDGIYTMNGKVAMECANMIQAKHSTPIHCNIAVGDNIAKGEMFAPEGKLVIPYGDTITLEGSMGE